MTKIPSIPCGTRLGHAAHEYDHPVYGRVRCAGLAFDYASLEVRRG